MFGWWHRRRAFRAESPRPRFRERYRHFRALLEANHRALSAMGDMAQRLAGDERFTMGFVRRSAREAMLQTREVVSHLVDMSGTRYLGLLDRLAAVLNDCKSVLLPHAQCPEGSRCPDRTCAACTHPGQAADTRPYVYDFAEVTSALLPEVGDKMARLGEVRRSLDLAVPPGFCLTVRCFNEFLSANGLRPHIRRIKDALDYEDAAAVQEASRTIQDLVVKSPIPPPVEQAILEAYDRLSAQLGRRPLLAVRSSAVGEDRPGHSFAGLHYTALNVGRDNLIDACWEVLVSKYLPQSLVYRYVNGLRDDDMPMSVGCLEMIDAETSGVLFTRDPYGRHDHMVIQAACGVGLALAQGRVQPQQFIADRHQPGLVHEFQPGFQTIVVRPRATEGLDESRLPADALQHPCLSGQQVAELVSAARRIEAHFGVAEDIEWAIDRDHRLYILQARALQSLETTPADAAPPAAAKRDHRCHPVLLQGGQRASRGVGAGPVFLVRRDSDLVDFPAGGVLVTRRASPVLTGVLHKAAALVAEVGSTTGHLAIIAREFRVPALMNLAGAVDALPPGLEVTVSADDQTIYRGRIPDLLAQAAGPENHRFRQSPVYQTLAALAEFVVPLHLTDPQSPDFASRRCRTLHDITRFAHEMAIQEMFRLGATADPADAEVRRLVFPVPLDVYVIDIDGGLCLRPRRPTVTPDEVVSTPLRALIRGMTAPGVRWSGPVPMDVKGFFGLIMNTMMDADRPMPDVGGRSYALVGTDYLNFFSRLGYHFTTVDALAGPVPDANYATFHFKGGAANPARRTRRARFIARVLESLGFTVDQKMDAVYGRVQNLPQASVLGLLEQIGRLLGAARNIDVTMHSDEQVEAYARAFLSGRSSPAEPPTAPSSPSAP